MTVIAFNTLVFQLKSLIRNNLIVVNKSVILNPKKSIKIMRLVQKKYTLLSFNHSLIYFIKYKITKKGYPKKYLDDPIIVRSNITIKPSKNYVKDTIVLPN